jgi:Protein of unknown function (DUF2975)
MRAPGHVLSFLAFLISTSWYFVATGLALTTCLVAVSPFVALPNMRLTVPVSFSVDPGIVRMTPSSPAVDPGDPGQNIRIGSEGFAFEIGKERRPTREPQLHVRGSVRFATQSRRLFVGAAILLVAVLSLVLWVLGHLRAVFRTLRDGQPFVAANATRIRRIALAVIFGEVGRAAIVFVMNYYASTHFAADGLRFDARPDFNIVAIFYGLIILVIAEVFRAGTRLDEDQSLTV